MHSSTSSSDRGRSPTVTSLWPGSWVPVLLVLLVCVIAWEGFWRSQGFRPSLSDDARLWSLSRTAATREGEGAVALVGSSRMQMDIHRETFQQATGWRRAVQLALVRGPSLPVLRHLAEDADFKGDVLCEIAPALFFSATPGFEQEIERILAVHDAMGWGDRVEQRLAMVVQGSLVTRLSRLQPIVIRNALFFRQMPTPRYEGEIGADRFRYADYARVGNIEALHARITRDLSGPAPEVLGREATRARIRKVEEWVEAIRARGGEVIFVRLPSSLMVLDRERRLWPREQMWDFFVEQTSAPTIHFADFPELEALVPPDGDHLGGRQAVRFAKRLGRILVARGLAPGSGF